MSKNYCDFCIKEYNTSNTNFIVSTEVNNDVYSSKVCSEQCKIALIKEWQSIILAVLVGERGYKDEYKC